MKRVAGFLIVLAYLIAFAANKVLDKTIGYDYDMTLAFSTPTFLAEREEDPDDRIAWHLVNGRLLDLEKKKHLSWTVPITRFFGYTPIVVTARPDIKAELFRAHVHRAYGIKPEDVYMTKRKAAILKERNTVLFFGDSDGDILDAREAGVRAIRIKRSKDDPYRGNYNPGKYGEFILPFSDAHL
ncbi:hypothetical protein HY522_09200 [bacterium]|nr:hypothetical protein [bacterium]